MIWVTVAKIAAHAIGCLPVSCDGKSHNWSVNASSEPFRYEKMKTEMSPAHLPSHYISLQTKMSKFSGLSWLVVLGWSDSKCRVERNHNVPTRSWLKLSESRVDTFVSDFIDWVLSMPPKIHMREAWRFVGWRCSARSKEKAKSNTHRASSLIFDWIKCEHVKAIFGSFVSHISAGRAASQSCVAHAHTHIKFNATNQCEFVSL